MGKLWSGAMGQGGSLAVEEDERAMVMNDVFGFFLMFGCLLMWEVARLRPFCPLFNTTSLISIKTTTYPTTSPFNHDNGDTAITIIEV